MFNRVVNPLKTRSFFLFGARGTGKTTFLRGQFNQKNSFWIDLLDIDLEMKLQKRPMELVEILKGIEKNKTIKWIIIDEIQKIPKLLDIIHKEIEKKRFLFALTGSSARKLKRGAANLLAGRAFENFLFPLTITELDKSFDLDFVLRWGSLPEVFSLGEIEKQEYLKTYVNTYLKEEIQIEQVVRKITPFRDFLEIAAQSSGEIINFSKIAREIGSDPVSVKSYFQILEDTLLGYFLYPYHESIRKRQMKSPKFYFFDLGVKRAIERKQSLAIEPRTYSYGKAFEHLVISEIMRLSHYFRKDWAFSYLRTKDNAEIDLIIELPNKKIILIEIKSTENIQKDDINNFIKISKEFKNAKTFCFSKDNLIKKIENVDCIHYRDGINNLFL